ncbi:MAG: sulfite exporter TauE/SafE family protein [Gemmatimonadetes bacterium]|jgi:sulfite exporter TauE/SafE|nr:sulfite exporter TauE/SafE family protein [Gemmatimonadota bacterium]MBK8061682.1 sulfite exporter TauE/SafE family protein [Gemmatimonadota bacterium]MBK9406634.1 sulfite exporter TauE/SafE family protein [Gemmatimonadota bacterium]MBK9979610.1 sulfite exporter TauE/SafE family protein [Gemmatimonadota bacterium]
MSAVLALGVLTASLLGSMHCAGMCGGFVCFYATGADGRAGGTGSHVAYNVGRLVSYLVLGLLAGVLGQGLDRVGGLVGLSRGAAVVSGTLMIGWGLSTILASRGIRLPRLEGLPVGRNPLGGLLARVRGQRPEVRAAATGLLTTLLPCGWLYAFVFTAAGTGRIDTALGTMAIFWVGTLPMMLSVGYGAQRLTGAFRSRLPMVTAAAVVVMGVLSITGRMRLDPEALSARARQLHVTSGSPSAAHGH